MPIITLDYSGHYPNWRGEVTEQELILLRQLSYKTFIFDSQKGRDLLKKIAKRPNLLDEGETFVAYQ